MAEQVELWVMTTGWTLLFTSRSGTQTLCDLSEVLNLSKPHGDFCFSSGKTWHAQLQNISPLKRL